MNTVFVDTGYLFALEIANDQHHQAATQHWHSIAGALPRLVTTSYVFDEVVTFFNSRGQHAKAMQVGNNLLQSPSVQFIHVDTALFDAGWAYFQRHQDKTVLPHGLYLLHCHATAGYSEGLCVRPAFCPSGLHQRAVALDSQKPCRTRAWS